MLDRFVQSNQFQPGNRVLDGRQLAGENGIMANLRQMRDRLWASDRPEDKNLGDLVGDMQDALMKRANIGAGREAYDRAIQSYARYKTIERAANRTAQSRLGQGWLDPESLIAELRSNNPGMTARGGNPGFYFSELGMPLQQYANEARGLVPTVAETTPQVSRMEMAMLTGGALGGGVGLGALEHIVPGVASRAAEAGWPAAIPLAIPPGLTFAPGAMSSLDVLANNVATAAGAAGAAGGQAVRPEIRVTPLPPEERIPEAQ